MIDRTGMDINGYRLKPEHQLPCGGGWYCNVGCASYRDHQGTERNGPTSYLSYTHCGHKKAVVVKYRGESAVLVEFNPSVLVHGGHLHPIANQAELDLGFKLMFEKLEEVAERITVAGVQLPLNYKFVSMELGWNFPIHFEHVHTKLGHCHCPWIRNKPSYKANVFCKLEGGECHFKFYNKRHILIRSRESDCLDSEGNDMPLTRAEAMFKGSRLERLFFEANIDATTQLPTFDELVSVVKLCLQAFETTPSPPPPQIRRSYVNAVAYLVALLHSLPRCPVLNGQKPFDLVVGLLPTKQVPYFRKRFESYMAMAPDNTSLMELFFPGGQLPPPPVFGS